MNRRTFFATVAAAFAAPLAAQGESLPPPMWVFNLPETSVSLDTGDTLYYALASEPNNLYWIRHDPATIRQG